MDDEEESFRKDPYGTLSSAALMKKSPCAGDSLAATCCGAQCGTRAGANANYYPKEEGKECGQRRSDDGC